MPSKATSKPGDLFVLGQHRLLCGDATKSDDVRRLMENNLASMMWTDPPYGVSYVGKTKEAKTIKNDGAKDLLPLLTAAFSAADAALSPGAGIAIAHPAGALSATFLDAWRTTSWRLHQTLVWVKDSMVLGHSDYHYRHEPILWGYKPGDGRYGRGGKGWYGNAKQTSVLEVPRPKSSEEHPTMKPVDLIVPMLMNSSRVGNIVFEPFGGSGSTLIACEHTKRRCFAIELDPQYVDVIVARWERIAGKKAVKA